MNRDQAIRAIAARLLRDAARHGTPITESTAQEMAASIVNACVADYYPGVGEMPDGPRTRGWRVTGQRRPLSRWDLLIGPRRRAAEVKVLAEIAENIAARRAIRLARKTLALAETNGATAREQEVFSMVRVEGLGQSEVARKLGITRQTVHKLLRSLERKALAVDRPESPPVGEGPSLLPEGG